MEMLFLISMFAAIYFAIQAKYWHNRAKELEDEYNKSMNSFN